MPSCTTVDNTTVDNNNSNTGNDTVSIPPEQIYCKKKACAIQYCLARYNHQEKRCKKFIDEYNRCVQEQRHEINK
jgi:hypothetical protein